MNAVHLLRAATLAAILVVVAAAPLAVHAQWWQQLRSLVPCSQCHAKLNATGNVGVCLAHGVNLTRTAHRGLVCTSCHEPGNFQVVRAGSVKVDLAVVAQNYSNRFLLNRFCGQCHWRQYEDYLHFAHGNETMECPGGGGMKILVRGYKGVAYWLYLCKSYHGFRVVHSKACVDCHNPHDPTFKPPKPLPVPSTRPPPPDESRLAVTGAAVFAFSWLVLVAALIADRAYRRRSGR